MQFTQTASDPCIYYRKTGIYVDDLILAARNEKQLKQVKENLSNKFNIKDLGELKYFLGIKVEQNKESGAYTENLLKRLGMQDSKPTSTPVEVSSKFQPATSQAEPVDQTEYQSAIGSLMYLAVSTRPDIAFAWTALKRILRYLKGTINIGILYKQDASEPDKCVGYSDAG